MKILEKLKMADAADRRKRLARYAEILKRGDAASADEITELQAIAAALGFDTARVEADARAIAERAHFVKMLESLPERERSKNATSAALTKHLDEMQATMQNLDNERVKLLNARNAAEAAYFAAARCERLLKDLDRKNWELFGIAEPADPDPFSRSESYRLPAAD